MKRIRLSRPAPSSVSSPVNLLGNAFAGLSRTLLFLSLATMGATWSTPAARAQGVTFAYAQTTLAILSGQDSPNPYGSRGLAVDSSGNVFFANDVYGEVDEILAVNGSIPANPTIKRVVGGGYDGLAVDANGNLYLAGGGLGEILAVNGVIPDNPTTKIVGTGQFNRVVGLAVDAKGDVFVADVGDSDVKEILAVNGSVPADPEITTLGSGFSAPNGIAVDGSGNVYVADTFANAVYEILAVDGSIPASPTIKIVNDQIKFPYGVAVDAKSDVFVAANSQNAVEEILAVDGSIPANPTIDTPGFFFYVPYAVAVDTKGDVFVTGINWYSEVNELQLGSVNFGSVNVCPAGHTTPAPCSNTITLIYNVAAGTTIGGVNILTAGAKNLDFQAEANDTSTSLCSAQTYTSATSCTVNVTFAPLARGPRNGTVQIVDGSSNILATTQIYGSSVQHASQTIDFPAIEPQTALTPIDHLYAIASSGLPVRFASNTPTVCTISGIRADFLTAGSCDIIATQAGNSEYFAAITGQTFLVHHRGQVISFDPIAAQPVNTMLTLTATTDSELPITFASTTPTICSVSGSTASLLNTGTCTIQASQAGDATYFPSGPKTQSFTVE